MNSNTPKFKRHPLTSELIIPIGFRANGRAIWPIMGGDDTVEPAAETSGDGSNDTQTAAETATVTDGEAALGDAGKKALDAMKAERNQFRDSLKALTDEFAEFKAKAEGKEAEHRASQEAQKVKDEAIATANKRIVAAELRAAAKGEITEGALGDLTNFIDPGKFSVTEDGQVDQTEIAIAIKDLIKTKPFLAAQGQRFEGSADNGSRKESKPTQLGQSDLDRMSPEAIVEAKKAGRFNDLLGIR